MKQIIFLRILTLIKVRNDRDIYEINYEKLQDLGIKYLFFDLDNTIITYKEKEPCKSAVKHSYKALLFTYRKELTPFMQRKKVQYF
mgnify:CR=1 FL=1